MNTNVSDITLTIEGMHCGACVRRVTQALQRVPGTTVEEVRIGAARVQSEDPVPLVAALAKAGYPSHAEQQ
jgi:copper chaperone